MVKANAHRIRWFLSLQRILQFPRYFMAPSAAARLGRHSVAYDPDISRARVRSPLTGHAAATRLRNLRALAYQPSTRTSSPIEDSAVTKSIRVIAAAQPAPLVNPLRQYVVGTSAPRATTPQAYQSQTEPERVTERRFPTPEGVRASDTKPDDMRFVLDRSVSLAPINAASWAQGPSPDPYPTMRSPPGWAEKALSSLSPRGPGEQTSAENGARTFGSSVSLTHEESRRGDRLQGGGTGVSTLHLDGAALGRWAIQHLERALGKPATGMTGVDPRASTPRSRVAPF